MDVHVIALEGLHERLRHAIRLRAAHRSEAGNQAQADRKSDRLVGAVRTAVVGEPLEGVRSLSGTEASLNGLQHQIANHLPADATAARAPSHDLPVAGVECK